MPDSYVINCTTGEENVVEIPAEVKEVPVIPIIPTSLSPSEQIILADGEDVAIVTITGGPSATVEITINGEPLSLVLDDSGTDRLELTCDTPNTTLFVQAGTANAVIYAVEVPS